MYTIYKNAMDKVTADDALKARTVSYLLDKLGEKEAAAPFRFQAPRMRKLAVAACAVFLLCAIPIGGYAWYQTPTSYLSVDINPSIELGINTFGRVVSATAYNDDGATVLNGLSLENLKVGKAVSMIVDSAAEIGFILEDGSSFIAITAETNNEQTALRLQKEAKNGAEDAMETEDDDATILTDQVALERRDEAIALGLTPGKLNLIEKLQALDPTITVEDYKDASVKDIQKKFVELKKADDDALHLNDYDYDYNHDYNHDYQNNNSNSNNHSNGNNNGNPHNNKPESSTSPSSSPSPAAASAPGATTSASVDSNGNGNSSNNGNNGHGGANNPNKENNETDSSTKPSGGNNGNNKDDESKNDNGKNDKDSGTGSGGTNDNGSNNNGNGQKNDTGHDTGGGNGGKKS